MRACGYLLLSLLACSGCASYPLGLTREQWKLLTPEEQSDYRARQSALAGQRSIQEAEIRSIRRRLSQEDLFNYNERIRERYENPGLGDVIRVSIQGGNLFLYGRSFRYYPVDFELARGETKKIVVNRVGQSIKDRMASAEFDASYAEDGSTFVFNSNSVNRIVLRNQGWETGQTYFTPERRDPTGQDIVGASFSIEFRQP